MRIKRMLSILVIIALCFSSVAVVYADDAPGGLLIMPAPTQNNEITVMFEDEAMTFDVAPIIENGRTLVPFRAIFEVMGCAVSYAEVEDGKKIVTAHCGSDSLMITIGENAMSLNGEKIDLDVPALIKDGRTLVPIRAITEALECEVLWDGDTKTVSIYKPAGHFGITVQKLAETIKDDDGSVLIEAVAFYPVIDNSLQIPFIDETNDDFKWEAEQFIAEAKERKADAQSLRAQLNDAEFNPFVFEMTFVETYNVSGVLSITNHKYMNVGGMHPTTELFSRTYNFGMEEELSVSDVLDEERIQEGLPEYVAGLYADKLIELEAFQDSEEAYDVALENIGYTEFYLTENSLVLYINQGVAFPYALGMISVEVPYDEELFFVDMRSNLIDVYTYECEYDKDFEWVVVDYPKDKLELSEEDVKYDEKDILSEHYPVGMKEIKVKGISKGNATVCLAYINKGGDISDATAAIISTLYVDENNKITVVTESDDVELLK